jgi:dihydrolipoamide dehydrogenase
MQTATDSGHKPASDLETISDSIHAEVVVLGAGPGGYTAAFRAADLGKQVTLIERHTNLGGVCLNVGCIPSKTLLHAAEVISEAEDLQRLGVDFQSPKIDLTLLRANKERVVKRLTRGLAVLAKQRKVRVLHGVGCFETANRIMVTSPAGQTAVTFDAAIIACGSRAVQIPSFPHDDPRLIDATGALALTDIPAQMLVIGGGIIGLEMATVYQALGSKIDIVELQPQIIPGCDPDLVKVLHQRIAKRYRHIMTYQSY